MQRFHYNDDQTESCYPVCERLLTRAEEVALFKVLEDGTPEQKAAARESIVYHNSGLVFSIASRYGGLDQSDLIQEGIVGMLTAVDRFDYRRGYKFSTYATWWIRQGIHRSIHNHANLIRVPVHLWKTMHKFNRLEATENQTMKEKAELLELSEDRLQSLIAVMAKTVSLDSPVKIDDEERPLYEVVPDTVTKSPAEETDSELLKGSLRQILETIPPRYKQILEMRFGLVDGMPRTLEFVGEYFGVCRERIRQAEAVALRLLRHPTRLNALKRCRDGNAEETIKPNMFVSCHENYSTEVCTVERFTLARKARGSHRSIGAQLGVSHMTIGRMERGEIPITDESWKALLTIPRKTHNKHVKYKKGKVTYHAVPTFQP